MKAGRRSGLAAMWVFLPMVVTGYLIQAVTHTGWLGALAWTHLGTGAIYLVGLGAHHRVVRQLLARRARTGSGANAPYLNGTSPAVERSSA